MGKIDITKLNTSWTKFDSAKVVEAIYKWDFTTGLDTLPIDHAVLRATLGIEDLNQPIPDYWVKIKDYPKQFRLFILMASLFNHHENIEKFALFSEQGKMKGILDIKKLPGKNGTNVRRALINAGAALESYSRKDEVPYTFAPLVESGDVGLLIKELFQNRLQRIGYKLDEISSDKDFISVCIKHQFLKAIGIYKNQFEKWIKGESIELSEKSFQFKDLKVYNTIPMLRVNQWLNEWDNVDFSSPLRRKPDPYFYIFNIDARLLKKLSDVHRRNPEGKRADDSAIQRGKNDQRIQEIEKYIEGGFPWSTISKTEQQNPSNERLKMPGLLPTAIIANIIGPEEERNGRKIKEGDLLKVQFGDEAKKTNPKLIIPDNIFEDNWSPELRPIEIIDGQHRLWAFDENQALSGNFELPVVAFYNLDRAWQAYLFYTINIKPVKINTSLGYDIYPLLRTQEWLENSKDGLIAYRENRAQEIVECLWLYEYSPWYKRINMIGESGGPTMSQAAFIRTLVNSFFKNSKGLFSDKINDKYQIINWNRTQQAAFIVWIWQEMAKAIKESEEPWAVALRKENGAQLFDSENDLAFTGKNSFLSRDQGVRGLMMFFNDFFFVVAAYGKTDLNQIEWDKDLDEQSISMDNLAYAIELFKKHKELKDLIEKICKSLIYVDWRTPSANFELKEESERQMIYRGSGGYSAFYREIVSTASAKIQDKKILGYLTQLS